jgi:hypothetical protein
MSRLRLLQAAAAAEKAWMTEVEAIFGVRNATFARYQDRGAGEPGSQLRVLYDAFVAARAAYQATH